MVEDLYKVETCDPPGALVVLGDSRDTDNIVEQHSLNKFSAVICSPPYPTEHDYTRNSRLELAFLGSIQNRDDVRKIKKTMVRSHTKGIYIDDCDELLVHKYRSICKLADELSDRIKSKTHGFAQLYPSVVLNYFGGMKRHLESVKRVLRPEAQLAYLVGDQSSYLRVHIPTAAILAEIAVDLGYEITEIRHWRSRWSTTTSKEIDENILILKYSG
jgi:hypothetical protein